VNLKEAQKLAQPAAPRRTSSSALLKGSKELLIVHNGRSYRLRLTKNGKLILTA
jgi:hemin uptake protein HemP